MPVDLDPPTTAIMAAMADAGYIIAIGSDHDGRIVGKKKGDAQCGQTRGGSDI